MSRTYHYHGFDIEVAVETDHYHGFDIEVAVETDFSWKAGPSATNSFGFVAVVRISKAGGSVAVFSPLRFGESSGKPFFSEADALMGGYSAGGRIVDDLFTS
jgi:hypothetical protein